MNSVLYPLKRAPKVALFLYFLTSLFLSCTKDDITSDNENESEEEIIDESEESAYMQPIIYLEPFDGEEDVSQYYILSWVPVDTMYLVPNSYRYSHYNIYLGTDEDIPIFHTGQLGSTEQMNRREELKVRLEPNKTYKWKVEYFNNQNEIVYQSALNTFSTISDTVVPSVRLLNVYDYMEVYMRSTIEIVHQGYSAVTEKGICISTDPKPDINDLCYPATKVLTYSSDNTVRFNQLERNTTYYIRAYAKNSYGVGYSSEYTFRTPETSSMRDNDGNYYVTVKIGNKWWMAKDLETKKYNNGDLIGFDKVSNEHKYAAAVDDGFVYSWHTIMDKRGIATEGWRIPTADDYKNLLSAIENGKEISKIILNSSSLALDRVSANITGFSAPGQTGYYWTQSENNGLGLAYVFNRHNWTEHLFQLDKNEEGRVRLVKDAD